MKKIFVLVTVSLLVLGVTHLGFADANERGRKVPVFKGEDSSFASPDWWVSKIQGSNITITNSAGQVKEIAGTASAGFKVGDKVKLQGNAIAHSDGNGPAGGQGAAQEAREAPRKVTTPVK